MNAIRHISINEFSQVFKEKKNAIFLDVRTKEEFARGKIPGSLNIPLDELAQNVLNVIPDKKTLLYVYCLSGARSLPAAQILINLGYACVYNLENGLLAWRMKHYPLVM